jgi:branched-chain amino acid transport system ATP-binding protein
MLVVEGVDVFYGKIQALKNVSLRVDKGTVVSLLGANGAGKTTLFNAICGFLPPTKGAVRYLGQSLNKKKTYEIVKLGIGQVSQQRDLFTDLTVLENLRLGGSLLKDKNKVQKKLGEIYEDFAILRTRENQKAGTLSGGEQQMLAIGRALMAEPRLLLLDEPTTGLAPIYVERITELLTRLKARSITMLLVEQNAPMAVALSDYFYVLRNGRIVTEGATESLPEDVGSFFHKHYI